MKICAALALALVCPSLVGASDFPDLVVPAGMGVNIHFVTGHETDLDKIAAAGFKFIRMDFSWQATEPQKGVYSWAEYDQLTANLEKRGIRALYILDYSNPLYEETVVSRNPITGKEDRNLASPQHPESVAAFAKWAAAAAAHFRDKRVVWEIWNEPNISFWSPRPDVQQYNTLAMATTKAIRGVDPKATIIGPGTSEVPREFLDGFLASGIMEFIDGVSVHPYRHFKRDPETAREDYERLRTQIEKFGATPQQKKLPIISSEWGYTSKTNELSLEMQAAFIVRNQLVNLMQGIPLSIWYDWKNDGPDPKEGEHNFGTVTHDLQPKPAYIAFQTFTKELTGYRFVKRIETGSANDFVLLMADSKGNRKLAVWTSGETHQAVVTLDSLKSGEVTAVNWKGDARILRTDGKKVELDLSRNPGYLGL